MKMALILILTFFSTVAMASTPVETHGTLRVDGNRIVGDHLESVQLMGMSLYWSIWGGQHFYNSDVVDELVDDWKVSAIRTAMAVRSRDGLVGYMLEAQRDLQLGYVTDVIEAAIDRGIYVVVDWHAYDAATQDVNEILDDAIEFFSFIAREYGNYPNIIYEPLNEPIGPTSGIDDYWADEIKPYHEAVIEAIREYDEDNLIVVGTPRWCQRVDIASLDPITTDDNVAYSLHFYAGTHKAAQRNIAQTALDNGVALFVTEWGTTQASGDGAPDYHSTIDWVEFLNENHISALNWSLSRQNEGSAALMPFADYNGNWDVEEGLTASGTFVRGIIRHAAGYETDVFDSIPEIELIPGGPGDPDAAIGGNMLQNGDFSAGLRSWNFNAMQTAVATDEVVDGEFVVEIENEGADHWNIQFTQVGVRLEQGEKYRILFDAYADAPRTIEANVGQSSGEYFSYIAPGTGSIEITEEKETYQIDFTMLSTSDIYARIEFNLGLHSSETVYLDNVVLSQIGTSVMEVESEVVQNELEIYPNPFNPIANISFSISEPSEVSVKVFDINGKLVHSLSPGVLNAGVHTHVFNGSNLPSGVYFVRLETGANNKIDRRMILLK